MRTPHHDSQPHIKKVNEAISFIVNYDTEEEFDYFWEKLSAVPGVEQCGWLKDKYVVSWRVVTAGMDEMLQSDERERID